MSFDPESIEPGQRNGFADEMQRVHEYCRAATDYAQSLQEQQANRHRRPAPVFQEGEMVYVSIAHLPGQRPSRKLRERFSGPFKISKMVTPLVARLELPEGQLNHNEFHVSLLREAGDPYSSQQNTDPPPIDAEENVYEVESIEDSQRRAGKLEYLVKWLGYQRANWEPEENVTGSAELVEAFHLQFPEKPKRD